MRTFGRKLSGTSTSGKWPAMCDYCGCAWPREQLRKDAMGLLVCPQEGDGPDLRTRQRTQQALMRAERDHVTSYDGAPYHFPPTVIEAPVYDQLLLQQLSTESMLFAFCPGERVNGEYSGALFSARVGAEQAQEIGYGTDQLYDAAVLAALCGSSDGFVAEIHDQLGTGFSLRQGVSGFQPKVWDGATQLPLTTGAAGLLSPTWDGVKSAMLAGVDVEIIRETALTVAMLFKRLDAPSSDYLWEFGNTRASNTSLELRERTISAGDVVINANGGIARSGFDLDTWQDLVLITQAHGVVTDIVTTQNGVDITGGTLATALTLDTTKNRFSVASGLAGSTGWSNLAVGAVFVWTRAIDEDERAVLLQWTRAHL